MKAFSFTEWLASGGTSYTSGYSKSLTYSRMGWVFAAINRIALTASSAPLIFYQGKPNTLPTYDPDDIITDVEHPALKLFSPPKFPIILSLRDLLYRTFIHLGVDGKVFWIIERKGSVPTNINLKDKNSLTPILTGVNQDELVGWADIKTGKKIPLDSVLLFQEYNPDLTGGVSLNGISPLEPARLSLDTEYNINGWNASFFKTGMKAPLLLQSKSLLSKEQKMDLRKEVINYYSGIDGGHGALLLQGGVEAKPLIVGTKDIDFVQGKKLNREEILAVYGVPPSLVGLFEYSSYANAEEQTKTFWEQTLLPRMSAILDLIQVNILTPSFPGVYAAWDTTKVAGLRPDPVKLAPAVQAYLSMGYHPTQVSRIVGMPDLVPHDDFNFDRLNVLKVAAPAPSTTNETDPATTTEKPPNEKPPKKKPKPKKCYETIEFYRNTLSQRYDIYCSIKQPTDDLWEHLVCSVFSSIEKKLNVDLSVLYGHFLKFASFTTKDLVKQKEQIIGLVISFIEKQIFN